MALILSAGSHLWRSRLIGLVVIIVYPFGLLYPAHLANISHVGYDYSRTIKAKLWHKPHPEHRGARINKNEEQSKAIFPGQRLINDFPLIPECIHAASDVG